MEHSFRHRLPVDAGAVRSQIAYKNLSDSENKLLNNSNSKTVFLSLREKMLNLLLNKGVIL